MASFLASLFFFRSRSKFFFFPIALAIDALTRVALALNHPTDENPGAAQPKPANLADVNDARLHLLALLNSLVRPECSGAHVYPCDLALPALSCFSCAMSLV